MVAEVARRNALANVLEIVTITDSNGQTVDLNALTPGAGAADEAVADEAEASEGGEAAETDGDAETADKTE